MFRALQSKNFAPFGEFCINFPPVDKKNADLAEVHLITGVNGCGKTRLLAVLAAMLGNDIELRKRLKGAEGAVTFTTTNQTGASKTPVNQNVFRAGYEGVSWISLGPMRDWFIHVPAFAYNGAAYVCDANISVMAGVPRPDRATCLSFSRPDKHSEKLLQAIANLKVQAAMDSMNESKATRSTGLIRALEGALSTITGQNFAFNVTTYPKPSLQVRWASSESLPFDVLPDGLRAIIGWLVDAVVMMDAWLQGKGSVADTEAVFLLDEIESHLHPIWQRRILPAFQKLFPKAQIFVATHSPFVISSLNCGWIHRLTMTGDGASKVMEPIAASAGDSYISVLEDIMGLDEWYDPETENLLAEFRVKKKLAYEGDSQAEQDAIKLAEQVGNRSMELRFMMGKELSQMQRQLGKTEPK